MKKIILAIIVVFAVYGFTTFESGKEFDKKMVGSWKGFEKDQETEGIEKHWIQHRFKDGTYMIMFTSIQNCEVETHTEKGKWWTENGKFYEYHEDSKLTDVYDYEVVDGLMVKFKSIKLVGEDNSTYEFIDYKIE